MGTGVEGIDTLVQSSYWRLQSPLAMGSGGNGQHGWATEGEATSPSIGASVGRGRALLVGMLCVHCKMQILLWLRTCSAGPSPQITHQRDSAAKRLIARCRGAAIPGVSVAGSTTQGTDASCLCGGIQTVLQVPARLFWRLRHYGFLWTSCVCARARAYVCVRACVCVCARACGCMMARTHMYMSGKCLRSNRFRSAPGGRLY